MKSVVSLKTLVGSIEWRLRWTPDGSSAKELAQHYNVPERRIRLAIRAMVRSGTPIVASPAGGFKLLRDPVQLEAYAIRLSRLSAQIQERAACVAATASFLRNQISA